jgi:hypothetical protein
MFKKPVYITQICHAASDSGRAFSLSEYAY